MTIKQYILNQLVAFDQSVNTLLGGYPDETISARSYRNNWKVAQFIINCIACNKKHCQHAYEFEIDLPKPYQNQKVDDR